MLKIAMLLLLSQADAPENDPFDHNVPTLAIDDKVSSGEPSFAHISICVGSNDDGQPVLLLDRLCLNHEAAQVIQDEIKADLASDAKDRVELAKTKTLLAQEKGRSANFQFMSLMGIGFSILIGIAAYKAGSAR